MKRKKGQYACGYTSEDIFKDEEERTRVYNLSEVDKELFISNKIEELNRIKEVQSLYLAKEKSKRERALKKAEEKVTLLETEADNLNSELQKEENMADYVKLSQLQAELEAAEAALLDAMTEWEEAEKALAEIL